MILIWDNGLDYSGHDIDFVELDGVPVDDAVALMRMHDSDGYVIGVADHIEWRRGAIGHLFDFVSPWFELSKAGDIPRDLCLRVLDYEEKRLHELIEENKKREGNKWSASVDNNLMAALAEVADARAALALRV